MSTFERLERVERDRDEWKDAACKLEQRAEEAERERDAALRVKGQLVEALDILVGAPGVAEKIAGLPDDAMGTIWLTAEDMRDALAALKAAKETP